MATLEVKCGDTLTFSGTRTDSSGNAVSLSGASVASEMVRGSTRQALTAEIVDAAAGTFRLTLPPVTTKGLAVGLWRSDVEFTDAGGGVISTDTYFIEITEDVTNAAS